MSATRDATLVVQTAFLGDVVLTTPLLSALAARHGPVDVVTTPGAAALLETHPAVRQVIRHDKHHTERGLRGVVQLGTRLRAEGYARAYLPHRSWRSGLAAWLANVPERIGFADAPARITYTRRVPRDTTAHETARLLALAGASDGDYPMSLGLTADDWAAADAWLELHRVPEQFVALAPGSVWATKKWGKYPALAASLDTSVVAIGGPEDRALGDEVAAAAKGRGVNAAGALPLRVSAAVIARARALVTNDSAPLHLAQAVGTPTVALFGPTVTAFGFGPRGPHDTVVELADLPCRPCSAHGPQRCPLGHHRCMVMLDLLRVLQALDPLLTL